MKRLSSFLTFFFLTLAAGSFAPAVVAGSEKYCDHHKSHHQDGHHGGRYHHGHRNGNFLHMLYELDLTDDQKKKILAIREDAQPGVREQREKMRDIRTKMRAVVLNDNYDEEKIKTLARKKADISADLVMSKAKMKNRMYMVLSEKQKQELETRIDKYSKEKIEK